MKGNCMGEKIYQIENPPLYEGYQGFVPFLLMGLWENQNSRIMGSLFYEQAKLREAELSLKAESNPSQI